MQILIYTIQLRILAHLNERSESISNFFIFLTFLIIICGFAKLLLVIKNHILRNGMCSRASMNLSYLKKRKDSNFVRSTKNVIQNLEYFSSEEHET